MKRKFLGFVAGTAIALSFSVAPISVNAATPEDAAAYGVENGEIVNVKVESNTSIVIKYNTIISGFNRFCVN